MTSSTDLTPSATGDTDKTSWFEALTCGSRLALTLRLNDELATVHYRSDTEHFEPTIQTVQSPFDGDMVALLQQWGYEQLKSDHGFDFKVDYHVGPMFKDLGIDTRAESEGGPNVYLKLLHGNVPTVRRDEDRNFEELYIGQMYFHESSGTAYRITGGEFEFVLNAKAGMIALMEAYSTACSAEDFWGYKPTKEDLPQLRYISDLAWGLWNCVGKDNLQNVNYLVTSKIKNLATKKVIWQALEMVDPARGEIKSWPGHEFSTETEAGKALLGTPVGRWAGYFLLQHKTQLGGNKYISKIRVFDTNSDFMPWMLFYVSGPDQTS